MPILDYFIENKPKYNAYNIVPDRNIELLDLAKIIQKISQKDIDIKVAKEGFGLDYTGDNSRLKEEIPEVKFTETEAAVRSLYSYYEQNKNIIKKELLLQDK